jgi:hypothetical protein
MSADEARLILQQTATDLGDPGFDNHYGWGRVDLYEQNDFRATCASDDTYWAAHGEVFAFQLIDPVSQFELNATHISTPPESIRIDVEARKASPQANLSLRGSLFNFDLAEYVALAGAMPLATVDTVKTFELPAGADPSAFIDPSSGEIRLLLQTLQTFGAANVRTQIDNVVFQVK